MAARKKRTQRPAATAAVAVGVEPVAARHAGALVQTNLGRQPLAGKVTKVTRVVTLGGAASMRWPARCSGAWRGNRREGAAPH
jgi:hypothetical protein